MEGTREVSKLCQVKSGLESMEELVTKLEGVLALPRVPMTREQVSKDREPPTLPEKLEVQIVDILFLIKELSQRLVQILDLVAQVRESVG